MKERHDLINNVRIGIFLGLQDPSATACHVHVVGSRVADSFHDVHLVWVPQVCVGRDALGLGHVAANMTMKLGTVCLVKCVLNKTCMKKIKQISITSIKDH